MRGSAIGVVRMKLCVRLRLHRGSPSRSELWARARASSAQTKRSPMQELAVKRCVR